MRNRVLSEFAGLHISYRRVKNIYKSPVATGLRLEQNRARWAELSLPTVIKQAAAWEADTQATARNGTIR